MLHPVRPIGFTMLHRWGGQVWYIRCMAEQTTEFAGLAALDQVGPPAGDGIYPVLADVTDDAAVRAAVAQAGQALGGLDILVNNAGIGAAGTVEDNDDGEWHRVLDVNVLGIVRTTRAALPLLRRAVREHGRAAIVNTCSIAGTAGRRSPRSSRC